MYRNIAFYEIEKYLILNNMSNMPNNSKYTVGFNF